MRKLLILAIALLASRALASDITRTSVVAEMNVRRIAFGVLPLREDARLDQAADDRVTDMEEQNYWAHISPAGKQPFEWLRPHGYDFHYAAENLASGFDTVELLVDAWMESKGHRENILSPVYNDCGVSIIEGGTTGRAAGKSIVVMFAREVSAPASTDRLRAPRP
ncbi:MAG TPA: CAP domain-containing protein [Thermoanaerobaculia bacterium]|jgi:uncharacterized protein YkwD